MKGVLDRIVEISGRREPSHPPHRPPYLYQVPLDFIPGLGDRIYYKLIRAFKNEMNILHNVPISEIEKVAGNLIGMMIQKMREGTLKLEAGGGGIYGKVSRENLTDQLTLWGKSKR